MTDVPSSPPTVAVIGAGPAGLMAAEQLSARGLRTRLYDWMPLPGRKFLMAGRGGLNLTHSEPLGPFLDRYGARRADLADIVSAYPPAALTAWADALGAQTFVGSSGRVFPKAMKASGLLRAWLARLALQGIEMRMRHRWTGWDDSGALRFATLEGDVLERPEATVLALGGASWPRLGSDGAWTAILAARGLSVAPLQPANAGVLIRWSEHHVQRFAGAPLKPVSLCFNGRRVRGEAVVTARGLEGVGVYALSGDVRNALQRGCAAELVLDLRPDESLGALAARLASLRRGLSLSERLRRGARLSPAAQSVLREAHREGLASDAAVLAGQIKAAPLKVHAIAGLDRAISSAGGLRFEDLDNSLMVRALPGVFAAGEMLDWEAPTGGYLLQATFATAARAAEGAHAWLEAHGFAAAGGRTMLHPK